MSDTTIIWDAMLVRVQEDHPIIYQYVKGKTNSKQSAIGRLTGLIAPMFIGSYDVSKIRGVARIYLKQCETDYKSGKIKIKAIY